jgi:hypothetical protein
MLLKNTVKTNKKFGRKKSPDEQIDFSGNDSQDNSDRPGSGNSASVAGGLFDDHSQSTVRSPLVAKILEANPICADCGSTDPE